MKDNNDLLFYEKQRFNQWWLWLIIGGTFFITSVIPFCFGPTNINWVGASLLIVLGVLILLIFITARLETTITEQSLVVHFKPWVRKEWQWEDIKEAHPIDYGFIGGWGIRLWTNYGTAYNIRGSKGLHIKIDKKDYLIGTQKFEELSRVIQQLQQQEDVK